MGSKPPVSTMQYQCRGCQQHKETDRQPEHQLSFSSEVISIAPGLNCLTNLITISLKLTFGVSSQLAFLVPALVKSPTSQPQS